jgi:hypothetical protein
MVGIVATTLGGCSSGGSPSRSTNAAAGKLEQWLQAASESSNITVVIGDESRSEKIFPTGSSNTIRTDCQLLGYDVLQANQQLPTTDSVMTSDLNFAFGDDGSAATTCLKGASAGAFTPTGKSDISKVKIEISAADAEYLSAGDRYDSITGKELFPKSIVDQLEASVSGS